MRFTSSIAEFDLALSLELRRVSSGQCLAVDRLVGAITSGLAYNHAASRYLGTAESLKHSSPS